MEPVSLIGAISLGVGVGSLLGVMAFSVIGLKEAIDRRPSIARKFAVASLLLGGLSVTSLAGAFTARAALRISAPVAQAYSVHSPASKLVY